MHTVRISMTSVRSPIYQRLLFAVLIGVMGNFHAPVFAQMPFTPELSWEEFVNEYLTRSVTQEEELYADEETEWLQSLVQHPLQVNRADRKALLALPFLTEAQVDSLLSYRTQKRGIASLGELQLISGWDYYTRRYLSLFVRFDSLYLSSSYPDAGQKALRLGQKTVQGSHEIETRLDVPLYQRKGYETPAHPTPSNYFLGNGLHHTVRYRYHYKREVAYGLTLEKDAGEPVAKQGFYPYDYWSGFLMLCPQDQPWGFIAGDYEIMDQRGLFFGRDYFAGREQVVRAQSSRSVHFRPHTSGNEYRFFRGAAVRYQKHHWDALLFGSYRRLDARWADNPDTVRSIQTSGLHRTLAEVERRRTLGSWTGGAHVGLNYRKTDFSLDGYVVHYDHPVFPEYRTYNRYDFRGQTAGGASFSYCYKNKRFELQGEIAADHRLHLATEHTARYRVNTKCTLHAQYRQFSPHFISIYGNAIQQNGRVANEQGFLLGVRYLPLPRWEIIGYADLFRFPKPTYRTVLDHAKGMEVSLRSRSPLASRGQLNLRYRLKIRQQTITGHRLLEYRQNHRLQIGSVWNWKRFEMNVQADGACALRQTGKKSMGAMASVRTRWRPVRRFQLKNFAGYHWTDDFDAALYVYEPQLLHAGSFSSFAYHGLRLVVLADYELCKGLTLSCRFSSTRLLNRDVLSSGINQIQSPWKNDLSFQVRWVI